MRQNLPAAALIVLLATSAGAVAGLGRAWPYVDAGFGDMAPLPIATETAAAAVAGAVAAVVFVLLRPLFRRLDLGARLGDHSRGWVATAAATGLALAAPLVWIALRANRAWGYRPSELTEAYALVPNLLLAAAALGVVALLVPLLERWRGRGLRSAAILVGLALVVVVGSRLAASTPSDRATSSRPDVLLLLVDALRADRLGVAGHDRPTTPAIDGLAADGVLFRQAIAQSTFTKTSVASLFTGQNPSRHGVYWGHRPGPDGSLTADRLPEGSDTVAETLGRRGYLTAAWVQNSHLVAGSGFEQGFVRYWDDQGHAARINRLAVPWLARALPRHAIFAYLHYIDLHAPYRPPPAYRGRFGGTGDAYDGIDLDRWGAHLGAIREGRTELTGAEIDDLSNLYDEVLRSVDDRIGELLAALRERRLYEETLVVVTSDHGDAFGEHGTISHSSAPYDELVRVPLIVKLPGNRHAGRVVDDQVRLVDVMPTLLDTIGVEVPSDVDGCSLVPLMAGRGPLPRECRSAVIEITEATAATGPEDPPPTVALRTDRWKYIESVDGAELYDLSEDPGERRNLISDRRSVAERFASRVDALAAARARRGDARIELDEETLRDLRALGYVE